MDAAQALEVCLRRQVNASPQRVWEVVSSIDGMTRWLGPKHFEPQPGGRVLFDVQHGGKRWLMYGTVERFEPARALAFTWIEVDTAAHTVWPAPTLVTVAMEPSAGGTLVTLSHGGFEGLPDGVEQYQGYAEGWASLNDLETLAQMCEAEQ